MVVIVLEAIFFPLFIVLAILAGRGMKARQARRVEAYRKSPDSRIIRLS